MRHALKIPAEQIGMRLDLAISAFLPDSSRAKIQKYIRSGSCRVNGEIVTHTDMRLAGQEDIIIELPEAKGKLSPEAGNLSIIWQDDDFALIDKEAGIVTHPCPSCPTNTLVQRLLAFFPQLAKMDGERPGIVHRLDKDTSGLLLVALNEPARLKLSRAFANRDISKEYLALVYGNPPENGECVEPIGRHPTIKTRMAVLPEKQGGKQAHSQWRKLWTSPDCEISLLAVRIFTGRTHQIRVHLAHAGYPILGDAVYAPRKITEMAPRQMLHAWRLSFMHAFRNTAMSFQAAPPEDFMKTALKHTGDLKLLVITGSPGCGKSTFCHELEKLGLPVISSDVIVARLYAASGEATSWLERRFGRALLQTDGAIDKAALFDRLQSSPDFRREFEALVHSLVLDEILKFAAAQKKLGRPFAVVEIPLYFECGMRGMLRQHPFVIGVQCPQAERWRRIRENRAWTDSKIRTLEEWQWREERKMAACDVVVSNMGSAKELSEQAARILANLNGQKQIENEKTKTRLYSICGQDAG